MLFPEPTFAMYRANAVLSGMRPVGVPLRDDLSFDARAFVARVKAKQPALVYLAYPNNPTGVLYEEAAVLEVLRAADGLVVLDEGAAAHLSKVFEDQIVITSYSIHYTKLYERSRS